MFDIGFQELLLCGIIALVVLGPERLPEVARTAGRWVGKARQFINNVKQDLNSELNSEDLAEFKRLKEELLETRRMLHDSSTEFAKELSRTIPFDAQASRPGSEALADPSDLQTEKPAAKKPKAKKKTKTANKAKTTNAKKAPKTTKKKQAPAAKPRQAKTKKKKAVKAKKKHAGR